MGPHLVKSGKSLTFAEDKALVLQDFDHIRILSIGEDKVGMIKILEAPEVWKIVQIQVTPDHQGRGIGNQVLKQVLNRARKAGIPVALSVLRVNPAKRLYERLGFEVTAENDWSYEMWFGD